MSGEFTIKTLSFEGPLELLLSLIEKRKFFINDISLSKVADDYIAYVESLEELPINTTADFILVASTLLLIKSKSLLPTLNLTEEEEGSIADLERRLKLYKRFKELSGHISKLFGKKIIFAKNPSKFFEPIFSPSASMTKENLLLSMRDVLSRLPKEKELPSVSVKKIVSLEEMIERLADRIKKNISMSFGDFAKTQGKTEHSGAIHKTQRDEKFNIIVSFLALLELVKRGAVNVRQGNRGEDINIETGGVAIPSYE